MRNSKSIAFITFAGSPGEVDPKYRDIQQARKRLVDQARRSGDFSKAIGLDWPQLQALASAQGVPIPKDIHRYTFTPILLRLISLGAFGDFDYYLYAGSGCEINTNPLAKKDLARMMKLAKDRGIYVEHTLSPERVYTKKEVMIACGVSDADANSPQIMATFFMVCKGLHPGLIDKISEEWLQLAVDSRGILISGEFDRSIQDQVFVEHRNDQSLFSLILKKNAVASLREKQRYFRRFIPSIRGSRTYLWTPRNRTGTSVLPKGVERRINAIVLFPVENLFNLIHFNRTLLRWKRIRKR